MDLGVTVKSSDFLFDCFFLEWGVNIIYRILSVVLDSVFFLVKILLQALLFLFDVILLVETFRIFCVLEILLYMLILKQ